MSLFALSKSHTFASGHVHTRRHPPACTCGVEPRRAGGRGTSSLRHADLSAVWLIPRSIEAWRSGRSKSAVIIFLVTTMGSEDARLTSPVFLLGKILQRRGAWKDCQSSTRSHETSLLDTPQGGKALVAMTPQGSRGWASREQALPANLAALEGLCDFVTLGRARIADAR